MGFVSFHHFLRVMIKLQRRSGFAFQTRQTKSDCGNAALPILMVIIALLISVLSRLATHQEQAN